MKTQELSYLPTLGGGLTALGIIFSSDQLIGYSFIGAGVMLSIIRVKVEEKRTKIFIGDECDRINVEQRR